LPGIRFAKIWYCSAENRVENNTIALDIENNFGDPSEKSKFDIRGKLDK